jgi:hypothetical protein
LTIRIHLIDLNGSPVLSMTVPAGLEQDDMRSVAYLTERVPAG